MKLLFQNSAGNERVIADVDNWSSANNEMDKFMEERNYKSYYKRTWEENGRLIIDVGSWYEFFIIEPYLQILGLIPYKKIHVLNFNKRSVEQK